MKTDKTRSVSSFKHDEKRAAIPDSAHQGEEQMAGYSSAVGTTEGLMLFLSSRA